MNKKITFIRIQISFKEKNAQILYNKEMSPNKLAQTNKI